MANTFQPSILDLDSMITKLKTPSLSLPELKNYNLADYQYELLCKYISNFQSSLDDEHEVCIQLASFGQNILLNVTKIGYANPCLITFQGYVNDQFCKLIQHVSQLSFLIMSCPKAEPDKPPRRIGFTPINQ